MTEGEPANLPGFPISCLHMPFFSKTGASSLWLTGVSILEWPNLLEAIKRAQVVSVKGEEKV